MTLERDPRWEWIECPSLGMPTRWVKGECRHLDVVPVNVLSAYEIPPLLVAWLCLTCDRQFGPEGA